MIFLNLSFAIIIALLGYLIKVKKMDFLVSGYNTASKEKQEKYDVEKMCNSIGSMLYHISFILLLMSLADLLGALSSSSVMFVGWSIISIYVIVKLIYLNTGNRLMKS